MAILEDCRPKTQPSSADALEANRIAQAAWRALCSDRKTDPEHAVLRYVDEYPGILPECFRAEDDDDPLEQKYRRRKGIELVYGKAQNGVRPGGAVGRCRVLAREPLEHRVVHFRDIHDPDDDHRDIEKFKTLRFCTLSQFSTMQMESLIDALAKHLPDLCFFVIERSAELHLHFLCKPGASKLGSKARIVPDDNLVTLAGYLAKRPIGTLENMMAYVIVRKAQGGRVATRHSVKGFGTRHVTVSLEQIEAVLGACPSSQIDTESQLATRISLEIEKPLATRSNNRDPLVDTLATRREQVAA